MMKVMESSIFKNYKAENRTMVRGNIIPSLDRLAESDGLGELVSDYELELEELAAKVDDNSQATGRNANTNPEIKAEIKAELDAEIEEKLAEQEAKRAEKQGELARLKEEMEASKKQAAAMKKAFDTMIKCLKISGNIISGDDVPAADHSYLLKNDPELYMKSLSARVNKEDPKEAEQVTEEDAQANAIKSATRNVMESATASMASQPSAPAEGGQ